MDSEMVLVPKKFLEQQEERLIRIENLISGKLETDLSNEWIEARKIPSMLSISERTWQRWRNAKLIQTSKVNSKIYVKRSDVEKLLMSNQS